MVRRPPGQRYRRSVGESIPAPADAVLHDKKRGRHGPQAMACISKVHMKGQCARWAHRSPGQRRESGFDESPVHEARLAIPRGDQDANPSRHQGTSTAQSVGEKYVSNGYE